MRMSLDEVVKAVESLYADEIRPFGRILVKRCAERRCADGDDMPRVDTAHLRMVCEQSNLLKVVLEESTEYSVLLPGRACRFVDASSNEDPYPDTLWAQVVAFFSDSEKRLLSLPSGRYSCARAFATLVPGLLVDYSLGQICHIVQLAISRRKILGFRNNHVVPYDSSAAMVKKRCADLAQPALELKKDTLPTSSLVQARQCLQAILSSSHHSNTGSLPLSNVKRLFRSRFGLELSETALGHTRICDLLRDERFADICKLTVQGSTHTVSRQWFRPDRLARRG